DHAVEISPEGERGQCNGRGKTDRGRNDSGHESERRMINAGEKMVFAAGTWDGGVQLTITKRAAEGGDAADNPEQQQRETGLNMLQLEPEAGEHAGPDNVGDDDSA